MAYTYYLFHLPTGTKYYGEQHGRNANPLNLWKTYFSSSKKVHALIEKYGVDSFLVEVRKIFETPDEAFWWEQRVLQRIRAVEREDWLNQSTGHGPFYWQGSPTEDHIKKNREAQIQHTKRRNYVNPFKGKRHTKESREQMSKSHTGNRGCLGRTYSKETLQKMSKSHKGQLAWNKGIPQSEETKKKLSEAMIGHKSSDKQKRAVSKAMKGRKQSKEQIEKRVISRRITLEKKKAVLINRV